MLTLIIFIAVISVLIFVHELGHFLTARRLGVAVEEFGFGFPPRMIGIRRRQTVYSINWLPFGGFVKLKGETAGSSQDANSFAQQSKARRFVILSAGVGMNYLLTIILFTIGFASGLPAAVSSGEQHPRITDIRPQVVTVLPTGPAAGVDIRPGDALIRANDTELRSAQDLQNMEQGIGDQPLRLTIKRGTEEKDLAIQPQIIDGAPRLGVSLLDVGTIRYPFPESLWRGAQSTVSLTGQIFQSFGNLLRDLIVERKVSPDLAGPIGIVVLTGQAADLGFAYLLQFVAVLSATLAVVNFFPFPALDGGRALFVIIEAVRRRAVDQRIESIVHAVGFYFLIAMIILVSLRDIGRFRIFDTLRGVLGS